MRRIGMAPAPRLLWAIVAAAMLLLAARIAGASIVSVWAVAAAVSTTAGAALAVDVWRSRQAWRASNVTMRRRLAPAFAIGVRATVRIDVDVEGTRGWTCRLFDFADPTLAFDGLPIDLSLAPGTRTETSYTIVPTLRGDVTFAPADVRVRSIWGLCDLVERLGAADTRRVYPDFSQVARYAWLAGDRRLQEMGIKTFQQRGEGTDFKQLAEYHYGDPVRHIDWRATQRVGKPIVRQFQDERDQCVLLLLDCGRRMRADDRTARIGTTHFDQVLNAAMLLAYVALDGGDAVGVSTFGTAAGQARSISPRKGTRALNVLMGELSGVQPTLTHSDYLDAAQTLMRRHSKRALVVVITNFRDEDGPELGQALKLLRTRHLVLLASVRERVVDDLAAASLDSPDGALDVASARLYEQARHDAFIRLASKDNLLVDARPERLGIELVNRYHAVKRAGRI